MDNEGRRRYGQHLPHSAAIALRATEGPYRLMSPSEEATVNPADIARTPDGIPRIPVRIYGDGTKPPQRNSVDGSTIGEQDIRLSAEPSGPTMEEGLIYELWPRA